MAITGPIPLPEDAGSILASIPEEYLKTKKLAAQANLPFGGAQVKGPAGQVVGLEMVKQLYGENSPQYQQAQAAFNLGQQSVQSRVDYQNVLSGTAGKRFSTPLGKEAQEMEDVNNGFLPGTKIPLTPDQKNYYQNKYQLSLLKKTSDADTRKRTQFANNIEVTLSKIDPDDLTHYSGLAGLGKLAGEHVNSAGGGKASPEFKKYQVAATNAKLLAKQVRQFYGDSIQPSVQKDLSDLSNPTFWLRSPEIAKERFNTFTDTLRAEMKQYKSALNASSSFGDTGSSNTASGKSGNQSSDQTASTKPVRTYNLQTGKFE